MEYLFIKYPIILSNIIIHYQYQYLYMLSKYLSVDCNVKFNKA